MGVKEIHLKRAMGRAYYKKLGSSEIRNGHQPSSRHADRGE